MDTILYGDHVRVHRGAYWHHGIYSGRNRVVHYVKSGAKRRAVIRETALEDFSQGAPVRVQTYPACFSPGHTVRLARQCVGQALGGGKYNGVINNCEHFATWCKTRVAESDQAQRGVRAASGAVTVVGGIIARKFLQKTVLAPLGPAGIILGSLWTALEVLDWLADMDDKKEAKAK